MPPEKPKKNIAVPVIVSAFFPGAGQLIQGRFLAAGIFLTLFLGLFGIFMWASIKAIAGFYSIAFEFDTATPEKVDPRDFLIPFLLAVMVWIINMVDAAVAYFQARSAMARQRLADEFIESPTETGDQSGKA